MYVSRFSCAMNLFMMIFGGVLLVLIIVGVIVYFTVFHNREDEKQQRDMIHMIKEASMQMSRR